MTLTQRTVIIFILVGFIKCQSLNDLDVDVKKTLEKAGLGSDIGDLPDFNSSSIPNAEDIEAVLREKCAKNGAPDAIDLLMAEQADAIECIQNYINATKIQTELEDAKATGSMDEVFAEYCKKWPDIHECFDNATNIARQCLNKQEESALNKSLDILDELQEFMCFKDGDRLAMFISEKGVECLQERQDGLKDCFNRTVGSRFPDPEDLSVTTLPVLLFTEQDCEDFDTLRQCVIEELEHCKTSTPANIIDALFKFLKKHLPCSGAVKTDKSVSKDSGMWSSSVSFVLLVGSFLYIRVF
ncbi:unnamed protein product [Phyllotreta striolata]|uniref:Uncharacterized protein n=1 Tax=Phyllotreta striolata TaxID=444603 RepID=A0A9N9XPB9_PHYSR|nr:unnamed protein product [Phyllotreta striolata]